MESKQKYKVFINDQPVLFIRKTGREPSGYVFSASSEQLPEQLAGLAPNEILCIQSEHPEQTWNAFVSGHEVLHAAGGVVWNRDAVPAVLMIHRLGKWDLPKGKIDPGESPEVAAIREVEEECGIHGMYLGRRIDDTWHMYKHKGSWKLKHTYWFEMDYPGNEPLVPQTEESIDEARWVTPSEMVWLLPDAYASIRELLQTVVRMDVR